MMDMLLQMSELNFDTSRLAEMYRLALEENRKSDAELIIKTLTDISRGNNLSSFAINAAQWQDIKEKSAQAIGKIMAYTALEKSAN